MVRGPTTSSPQQSSSRDSIEQDSMTSDPSPIEIRLRVDHVGTTSIRYAWRISKDGTPYVEGRHTVVHVDADDRPEPLPHAVRAALSA